MSVVAFVPDPSRAALIVNWTNAIKESVEEVEYLCFCEDFEDSTVIAVEERLEELGITDARVRQVRSTAPVSEVLDECRLRKARLLVTGGFQLPKAGGKEQSAIELIRSAPCMTVAPLFGNTSPSKVKRALTVIGSEQHGVATLRLTEMLRQKVGFKTTVATVEEESGTKAERAGQKAVRTLLNDAGLDEDDYQIEVAVDRLRHRGILSVVNNHDLIVCGASNAKDVIPLEQSIGDTTFIVVKRNPPLRLRSLGEWLPRINPRDHAELLQDLRAGSQWNGDFVSMLGLAAAIASLGLMQNSPAVVIGSMLLAPLMTPMIGAGLALAQANIRLATRCGNTILLGMLLTLVVSYTLGMVTPSRETLSPEVLSRGQPNVLDLMVALFSAFAATIAMSRPNISGAVAGVAIATALVPPLCAVGLSASHGSYTNAYGAILLFCTNLIAIIIASAVTFRLLGIVEGRAIRRNRRMAFSIQVALVVMLICLAGPLSQRYALQLNTGRDQTALFPVTRKVARALKEHIDKEEGVEIVLMGRSSVVEGVIIYISSNHLVPKDYADGLRSVVRETMDDPALPVYVICLKGQWISRNE